MNKICIWFIFDEEEKYFCDGNEIAVVKAISGGFDDGIAECRRKLTGLECE